MIDSASPRLEPYKLILESSEAFEVSGKVDYNDVASLRKSRADMFLMFAGGDDAEMLVYKLRSIAPLAELVVICESTQPERVISILKAGANGLISARSSLLEFMEAMNKTLCHGVALTPDIANIIVRSFHTVGGNEVLGNRERQVLELLGQGNTCSKIARRLGLSTETVKTHVKNIYKKLGAKRKSEAIARARAARIIPQRGSA